MNERVFPRFILEDAFLSDTVRSRLEHRLGCRMSRKVKGHEEERLLYALLMASADEIVLCHQRSDERGRLQIRSPFLPKGELKLVPRRPAERLRSEPLERLTPREASLRTGQGEALGRAMGWNVEPLIEATSFLRKIQSRGALTEFDGVVDARDYWNRVAAYGLSPTPLERLAECPFRFFAQRMLGLEELDEPEGEDFLSPLEIGQLYHDVLEKFHARGGLDRRLEECFREFEASRSIRYPVLWEVEKERIAAAVRALVEVDDLSFYKPRDFERELKAEIPLEVGGRKTIAFRGFVDRLDVGPGNAFRVIDYKKSRGKYPWIMKTGVFEKGRYLQPPIYFLLAHLTLGKVDLEKSKFSYYFIEEALEGEKWEMELTGGMWEEYDQFEAHLKHILETIPRGEFVIRPADHCRSCDYRVACRRSHAPTRLRAQEWEERRDAR
jgi:ATP-dependent helicase/nuclease subunit B